MLLVHQGGGGGGGGGEGGGGEWLVACTPTDRTWYICGRHAISHSLYKIAYDVR